MRGAAELRVKESDRITALARGFARMGAEVDEYPDGFTCAAAAARAAGRCLRRSPAGHGVRDRRDARRGPTTITGAEAVDVSYPGFFDDARAAHAR